MVDYILLAGLVTAAVFDIRSRRIPNWLVFSLIVLGFAYNLITNGPYGLLEGGFGFLLGLGLLLIPFSIGGVGAGDVKLLAAIGAVKGPSFVLASFLCGAVIGGLLAIAVLLKQKALIFTILNMLTRLVSGITGGGSMGTAFRTLSDGSQWGFPYGVAFALGAVVVTLFGFPLIL